MRIGYDVVRVYDFCYEHEEGVMDSFDTLDEAIAAATEYEKPEIKNANSFTIYQIVVTGWSNNL